MNKKEIGNQRIKDILGNKAQQIIDRFEKISPDFKNYVVEFGYGDLYNRKGLTDKQRELAAVACLIGQRNTGLALEAHLQGMINTGWKKEEVLELLIFLTGYSGFPTAAESIKIFAALSENEKIK